MLPNINELLYQSLASDIADLRKSVQQILTRAERAEVSGGLANSTLAALPTVNNTGGDHYYATDGLKPGESPGLGTGTPVFWNAATNAWLRYGDYSPPAGGGGPLGLSLGGTGAALNGAGGTSFYVKLGLAATAMSVGLIADGDLPVALAGHTITGGSIDNTPIGATTRNSVAATSMLIKPAAGAGQLQINDSVPTITLILSQSATLAQLTTNNGPFEFDAGSGGGFNSHQLYLLGTSNFIGIANGTPLTTLDVGGTIRATGSVVPASGSGVELAISGGIGLIRAINRGVTDLQLDIDGSTLFLNGNTLGPILFGGLITTYNNVATQGYGVPAVVTRVGSTNNSTDIADPTNLANANVAGEYIIDAYLVVTTADATAGTVTGTIKWNDGTAARSSPIGPGAVSLTATNFTNLSLPIRLGSGSISYSTSHTGAYNAARYAIYISCHRVN